MQAAEKKALTCCRLAKRSLTRGGHFSAISRLQTIASVLCDASGVDCLDCDDRSGPDLGTDEPTPNERILCGLTFELRGRRRQASGPALQKMHTCAVAPARLPAVGAPLERRVRPHRVRADCPDLKQIFHGCQHSATPCLYLERKPLFVGCSLTRHGVRQPRRSARTIASQTKAPRLRRPH